MQFALRHDRRRLWRYSPLQSEFAARQLARYGVNAADLDSIHALENYSGPDGPTDPSPDPAGLAGRSARPGAAEAKPDTSERLRSRSDAGALLWRTLAGWPRAVGWLLTLTPRLLREPLYRLIARHRYRLFGKFDHCRRPPEGQADLFLLD